MPHGAGVAFSRNCTAGRRSSALRTASCAWSGLERAPLTASATIIRVSLPSAIRCCALERSQSIRRYSQQFIDLIDLEDNSFKTLPVHDILDADYPPLRYVARRKKKGISSPSQHGDQGPHAPGVDFR